MPRVTITQKEKKSQPYRFKLEREVITLGRAEDNDIQFSGGPTSLHHCEIKRVNGGYILEDLESTNGIKQEGSKFEILDLYNGTEALLGDVDLKFELSEEELEELAEEGRFKKRQRAKLPDQQTKKEGVQAVELEESPHSKKKNKANAKPSPLKTNPSPSSAPATPAYQPAPAGTSPLLLLILATIALFIGMSIRHYMDHKTILFQDILGLIS